MHPECPHCGKCHNEWHGCPTSTYDPNLYSDYTPEMADAASLLMVEAAKRGWSKHWVFKGLTPYESFSEMLGPNLNELSEWRAVAKDYDCKSPDELYALLEAAWKALPELRAFINAEDERKHPWPDSHCNE